jgi:hypothetical protein
VSAAVLLDDAAIAFADARLHALTIAVAALPGRPQKSWSQDTFSTELIEAFLAGGRHRMGDTSPTLPMRVRQHADGYLETRVRALQARIMLLPAAASDSDRWARDTLKGELRDAFAAGALQATALLRERVA